MINIIDLKVINNSGVQVVIDERCRFLLMELYKSQEMLHQSKKLFSVSCFMTVCSDILARFASVTSIETTEKMIADLIGLFAENQTIQYLVAYDDDFHEEAAVIHKEVWVRLHEKDLNYLRDLICTLIEKVIFIDINDGKIREKIEQLLTKLESHPLSEDDKSFVASITDVTIYEGVDVAGFYNMILLVQKEFYHDNREDLDNLSLGLNKILNLIIKPKDKFTGAAYTPRYEDGKGGGSGSDPEGKEKDGTVKEQSMKESLRDLAALSLK